MFEFKEHTVRKHRESTILRSNILEAAAIAAASSNKNKRCECKFFVIIVKKVMHKCI